MSSTTDDLPYLYAIANTASLRDPQAFVKSLLLSGVQLLQIRDKSGQPEAIRSLVSYIRKEIKQLKLEESQRPKIIINDYPEICLELSADGVHLGQGDSDVAAARERLGPKAIIGLSTHNIDQFHAAPTELLSYIAMGPIFESSTKSGHAPTVGLATLREAAESSTLPVVAIGGINLTNAQAVYQAGAQSIALISDLERSSSIEQTIQEYGNEFNEAARSREPMGS